MYRDALVIVVTFVLFLKYFVARALDILVPIGLFGIEVLKVYFRHFYAYYFLQQRLISIELLVI